MKLSARNQIPARITGINGGQATANVEMDAGGVRLVAGPGRRQQGYRRHQGLRRHRGHGRLSST